MFHHGKRRQRPSQESEEDLLWEKGELGEGNGQTLLNSIVYMIGLYFALRSGNEHQNLQFESPQIPTY